MSEPRREVGPPGGESWGQLVRRVAAEFDHEPTGHDIDHILWEHTGYPGFWQGDPATECARQVRAFYQHRSEADWSCGSAWCDESGSRNGSDV